MGLFTRRAGYPDQALTFKTTVSKSVFCALICLQALFGTYYAWSEFNKGSHFNPLLSPSEFQTKVLKPAVQADIPAGDIEAYLKAANSFATRGNYTLESGLPSAWVTPGYPLALALSFKLFGFHFWSILLVNSLAWGVAFWAIAKMTEILRLSYLESVLGLVLFAGNLRLSMFVGYVYTECLFVAAVAWFFVFYMRAIQSERPLQIRTGVALGLLAGYGALIRPVFLGIAPLLLVLGIFLEKPLLPQRLSHRILSWSIAIGIALIPTALLVYRNTVEIGHPVLSTSSALARAEGAQDFYLSLPIIGIFKKVATQKPFLYEVGKYSIHPELDLFSTAKYWTDNWNRTHSFGEKTHLFLQRTIALFSPYIEAMSSRNRMVSQFYWLLIFPMAACGIFYLRHSVAAWVLCSSCILLIFYPSLVVVSTSLRYQIPGQVLLSPLAAVGLVRLFQRKGKA